MTWEEINKLPDEERMAATLAMIDQRPPTPEMIAHGLSLEPLVQAWHDEHPEEQPMTIPNRVTLSAIGYYVKVIENMVTFSTEPSIAGCYTRISFQRCSGCWYVSLIDSGDKVMVSHIEQAQELVSKWFGGNFKGRNGEHNL